MVGSRIRQARLWAEMSQAGVADALSSVGIPAKKEKVSNMERGKTKVDASTLLALSQLFDVPHVWLLHEPVDEVNWLGYRKLSSLPKKSREVIETYARDVASLQIELQEKLYPDVSFEFSEQIKVADFDGAEDAAQQLRDKWGFGDAPIENLTQSAEAKGVVIIYQELLTKQFDGLAGKLGDNTPVVVINAKVDTDRRRFSLAHELGHLVMELPSELSNEKKEKLAHRFAAALLVPKDVALRELGENRNTISFAELGSLKRRYGLSMQGWVYRASDLGIFTSGLARAFWREVSRRGWKKTEPFDFVADEEPVLLKQMVSRALEGGLVSGERIQQALPDFEFPPTFTEVTDPPTATELMKMPKGERESWTRRAFEQAKDVDFEVFEAFGEQELQFLND